MKDLILTVTLNPALDKTILKTEKDIPLSKEKYIFSAGGKGINVSRALDSFKHPNLAIGLLAGVTGQTVRKLLREEKIKSNFINVKGETRTNLTIISTAKKEIKRAIEIGPRVSQVDMNRFKRQFQNVLKESDCVVLAGRSANGAHDSIYAQLITLAHKTNVMTVLDTSGKALSEGIKAAPFMIKPNLMEAEEVLHTKLNSLKKVKEAINRFHQMGIKIVVISLADKGAIGSNQREIYHARTPKLSVKNDVGCGDSFLAGFLHSYCGDQSLKKAMHMGVAAGAANLNNYIPGLIDRKIFKQMIQCVKIKKA